jgi:hypothetical protein
LADVDLASAQAVTPPNAPVGGSLTGRERAGIYLTWGVLGIIIVFLILVLAALWWNESRSAALSSRVLEGAIDAAKLQAIAEERTSFRTFWLEITKTILLNVFLPVLTALLGYVFGTTQISSRQDS